MTSARSCGLDLHQFTVRQAPFFPVHILQNTRERRILECQICPHIYRRVDVEDQFKGFSNNQFSKNAIFINAKLILEKSN